MSEFAYINWLRHNPQLTHHVITGPGDDTAVLIGCQDERILFAIDTLLEGVHFTRDHASLEEIGRKALAVNLSDIAAMGGGKEISAVVSLTISKGMNIEDLKKIYAGMQGLAQEYNVSIVGGDTCSWQNPFAISVAVTAKADPKKIIPRSGAQEGDNIWVTGHLGGSIYGHHLLFTPRLREASILTRNLKINSMMDISDGLIKDLGHILKESGELGAMLYKDKIPISSVLNQHQNAKSLLEHACTDGEDFELLFTLTKEQSQLLETNKKPFFPALELTCIGEVTAKNTCLTWAGDGQPIRFAQSGWEHDF